MNFLKKSTHNLPDTTTTLSPPTRDGLFDLQQLRLRTEEEEAVLARRSRAVGPRTMHPQVTLRQRRRRQTYGPTLPAFKEREEDKRTVSRKQT